MKHIKSINEMRAHRQLHQLYYISNIELTDRHQLPSWYDRHSDHTGRRLVPTYTMIQDAVANISPTQHLYQCSVKAALGTEDQFFKWLIQRGYDPEEYLESLKEDGILPEGMGLDELSDLKWSFDGLEAGDVVFVWDLSMITNSMYEVQDSEIARVKKKLS